MKKVERILYVTLSVLLVLCTGFLFYELITFKAIPNQFLFLAIAVFCVLDVLLILLVNFYFKKKVGRIISAIFMVLIMVICGTIGYYVQATHSMLEKISTPSRGANMVSVIVKESSDYETIQDMKEKTIGMLSTISKDRTETCVKDIESHHVDFESQKYDSLSGMVDAFYKDEVEAIILPESSRSAITDLEDFANFNQNTRVIFQTEIEVNNNTEAKSVDDITSHSFNVLITGSDSRVDIEENARSDVNMVVTVNPNTQTILLTSIPRDYYVTTVCDADDGCQNGAMDKLTHTGMNGVNTTKMTIENLLGIEINYTFKVGFDSVTEVVNALGGIDVNVPEEAAVASSTQTKGFSIAAGQQHIDGKTALNFSRERYAYVDGDRQRTRNQQIVLMGIIDAVTSPSVLMNYTSLLEALGNTFETNLSSDEIASLVQFQLDKNPSWKIEQYMLDGTGDSLMCAEIGTTAYVMIPDQATVKEAKQKISDVLHADTSTSE